MTPDGSRRRRFEARRAALEEDPESPPHRLDRAAVLIEEGRPGEAVDLLDEESDDPDERTCLAAALCGLDRARGAERILLEVLAERPMHLGALRLLGRILVERERWEEAIPHLERLRHCAPTEAIGLVRLARAQRGQGFWDLARETLEDAVTIDPYEGLAHVEFGHLWESHGVWDRAHEAWSIAADLATGPDPEIESHRAETARRAGSTEGGTSP